MIAMTGLAMSQLLVADLGPLRLPSLWAALALGYVGVGAAMAWHLGRRGHGLGTATTALACWPLLLGLVGQAAPDRPLDLSPPIEPGQNRGRIDACVASLRRSLSEEELGPGPRLIEPAALDRLRLALHRADHRIARVDRLLAETRAHAPIVADAGVEAALTRLSQARDHAANELEAVLAGLVSIRVQLGLVSLVGDAEPVRGRLAELEARVAALAELSSIELGQVRS